VRLPAAVQRNTVCASRQRVTLRSVERAMAIIDSSGFEVPTSRPGGSTFLERQNCLSTARRPGRARRIRHLSWLHRMRTAPRRGAAVVHRHLVEYGTDVVSHRTREDEPLAISSFVRFARS